MSAQIGDYIHYHFSNYLAFGLSRKISVKQQKSTRGYNNPSAHQNALYAHVNGLKSQIRRILSSQKEEAKLYELQKRFNKYSSSKNYNGKITDINMLNQIDQAVYQYMATKINGLQPSDIDWDKLTINPSALQKIKVEQASVKLAASTLTVNSIGKGNVFYAGSFQKHVQDVRSLLEQARNSSSYNELNIKLSAIERASQTWKGALPISTLSYVNNNETFNYVNELSKIARDLLKVSVLQEMEGTLAEAVAAAVLRGVQEVGKKGTQEIFKHIQNSVVGSIKSNNIYITDNFASGVDMDTVFNIPKTKHISKNGIGWQVNLKTQGKIDVAMQINDEAYLASVKSYNLSNAGKLNTKNKQQYALTLVKGTPLLYLLQNDGYFVNHYLNQTVDTIESRYKNVIKQANKVMKELIILRSLAGGGQQSNSKTSGVMANLFIVNDKSGIGGIRIMSTPMVLEQLIAYNGLDQVNISNFNLNKTWDNSWGSSANARITKLISQLYQTKINASINLSQIKNMMFL